MDSMNLAIIGTAMVIGSALVTGPLIQLYERRVSELESDVANLQRELTSAYEKVQQSYQHFFPADIKLLILKTSEAFQDQPGELLSISKGVLQGIIERWVAAKGVGPTDEEFRDLEKTALRAGRGDPKGFEELSNISASLMSEWASRHKRLVTEKAQKQTQIEALKQKVATLRNVAVFLQILGLVFVLLKDIGEENKSNNDARLPLKDAAGQSKSCAYLSAPGVGR